MTGFAGKIECNEVTPGEGSRTEVHAIVTGTRCKLHLLFRSPEVTKSVNLTNKRIDRRDVPH